MKKRRDILKVTIDSPGAAGAGTQAKLIGKHQPDDVRHWALLSLRCVY